MGNVSWVSYSFSCRVKNLKCGDTTLLIGVPHTRSWRRSEKRATFTPTENLWLHGNQRVVGWFFWGVERGPFHVSCSAVCNYGGMQADRYHLTPAAPGSAIVTLLLLHCCYTLLHGQNRPKKERVWYKRCHRRRRTGLDNLNRTRSNPHCC